MPGISSTVLLTLGCFVFANSAQAVGGGTRQSQETLFSASIGKWQTLCIRKCEESGSRDDETPTGQVRSYYVVEIDDYTRDRDGQGVYRESVFRLLHCEAAGVKETKTAEGTGFELSFTPSQGDESSTVRIAATPHTDGDESFFTIAFSGKGPVFRSFQNQLTDKVAGAEWVESIDAIRWQESSK